MLLLLLVSWGEEGVPGEVGVGVGRGDGVVVCGH